MFYIFIQSRDEITRSVIQTAGLPLYYLLSSWYQSLRRPVAVEPSCVRLSEIPRVKRCLQVLTRRRSRYLYPATHVGPTVRLAPRHTQRVSASPRECSAFCVRAEHGTRARK